MSLPLMATLEGRRVVVVGAGPVGAAKLRALLEAGAAPVVVAPDAVEEVREQARQGRITWHERAWTPADLDCAWLVVAATSDPAVNDAVASESEVRATFCVRIDGRGSAALMGTVRRGPLTLAVSTGGASPALAKRIRTELAEAYGPEHGELARLLGALRDDPAVQALLQDLDDAARAARWRRLLDADILAAIRSGRTSLAEELALACLSSSSD